MKLSKITAITAAFGAAFALTACADNGEEAADTTETTVTEEASAEAAPEMPTAEELNLVLAQTTDSGLPMEERVNTVQGGETAPELFETMTLSKEESGADFQVVTPVLPGYSDDSVLATVNFTLPERPAQVADNVEFIYEDGYWKLSQSWACTLIENTVAEDQVPQMCTDGTVDEPPLEDQPGEEVPEGLPVEEQPAL